MEDLLEVQPKSGRRCHVGRVSDCTPQAGIHSRSRLCPKIVKTFVCCRSITISIQTVCVCVRLGSHDESEKRLPKSCLVLLCKYEPVLRWSRDCDNSLYQGLVEILIPDVLRPIPSKAL